MCDPTALIRKMRVDTVTIGGFAASTARSFCGGRRACSIVEVGSYCGKSTVVFGLALKQSSQDESRVFAIDPHDGRVSTLDGNIAATGPTFDKFRKNIRATGVASFVEPILGRSTEVGWDREIDLLFVDGLHTYDCVSADFRHFARWTRPAGRVVFHDCAPHFPGVQRLVSEIVRGGEYQLFARAKSLAVLKKAAP
jgi:predicted O-methyltransferase YrrM